MDQSKSGSSLMRAVNVVASITAAVALAVTFVAAGFAACAVPNVTTEALSRTFNADEGSPFTKDELVYAAVATKNYTVGSHDKAALYDTLLQINRQAADDNRAKTGAPDIDAWSGSGASNTPNIAEQERVTAQADESYVLTPDAVSHLDDVYNVVASAQVWLIAIAALAVASLAHVGYRKGQRSLGGALMAAGIGVLAAFALMAAWAAIDFSGFFAAFHSLFFAAGTWTFSYDSLLITMYPLEFWMGMGAVWLLVTSLLSLASVIMGTRLRRQ